MTTLVPHLNSGFSAPERHRAWLYDLATELAAPPVRPNEPEHQSLARLLVACGRPPLSAPRHRATSVRYFEREFSRSLLLHAQDAEREQKQAARKAGRRRF